jgi:peptidyl-prolyl cis-trans isomerase A (cyclophilin A)
MESEAAEFRTLADTPIQASHDSSSESVDPDGIILGKYLAPIAHEPTSLTGLRHRNGTISIARDAVGTGTAGAFFICIGDQPELNFGGRRNPDGQGFAAFGHVASGMKLIRAMGALKTQGPPGSSAGELIASPVQILGARRV